MKIATWNLQRPLLSNRRRRERIQEHLKRVDADIWVLTETHDVVIPGEDFRASSTEGFDRPSEPGERWVTIWSRFPAEPLSPTSDPVRSVAVRIAPPHGARIVVYGTVLPWLGSSWRGFPATNGQAFAAALEVQRTDWRQIRIAHPDHGLVVAGDFNQDLSSEHYYGSSMNRHALLRALSQSSLSAHTAGESDPVRRNSPDRACIDHICLSEASGWLPDASARWPDTARPDTRISDHFGVEVLFQPG